MSRLDREYDRIVNAGRADAPTTAARARMRRAVLAGVAAGASASTSSQAAASATASDVVSTGAAGAAVAKAGWLLSMKGLGVVAGVGVAVALGTLGFGPWARFGSSPAAPTVRSSASGGGEAEVGGPTTAPALAPAIAEPAPSETGEPPREADEAVPAHAPTREGEARRSRQTNGRSGEADPGTAQQPSVERALSPESLARRRESRLLRDAVAAQRAGDAPAAIAALQTHAGEFPEGVLAEEREALWAIVECERGDRGAAQAHRAHIVSKWPWSPLLDRVDGACRSASPQAAPAVGDGSRLAPTLKGTGEGVP